MRAGIQSVRKDQIFAGQALGLTYAQNMRYVVLPQAFRNMVPILMTQAIILFQDTSLVYVVGIVIFAVSPALQGGSWRGALLFGALFGMFCYATYDMTNLATLKNWPLAVVVADVAWGTALTAVSALAGYAITKAVA